MEPSSSAPILVEINDSIARITLNRPEKLNALNPGVLRLLKQEVERLAAAPAGSIRCAVVTGEGKAFVAGADIAAMQNMSPSEANDMAELGHAALDALEHLPFPVIAAVNGFALGGGCELALACDFIYASSRAKFAQPEVKLGIIPGFGGTARLSRRVGIARARELIYTGAMVSAEEAERIGLVNAVFPPDELLPKTLDAARSLSEVSGLAVRAAKQALREGEGHLLPEANAIEKRVFSACFGSEDQIEGMAAFVEKRPPRFNHGT